MIEELTPQLLVYSMLIVVALAPLLTLLLSMLLLGRYRHAVAAAMAASAAQLPGASHGATIAGVLPRSDTGTATFSVDQGDRLLTRLLHAPKLAAVRIAAAGLAYAATMALGTVVVFEPMRTLPRFALVLWGALWPVVPALAFTAPAALRTGVLALLTYLAPLFAVVAASLLIPEATVPMFGGQAAAIRAAWSPPEVFGVWLLLNGAPTLLPLLFLNRRTRAVGPLLLAFVTVVLVGCTLTLIALFMPRGVLVRAAVMQATTLSADTVLVGMALLAAGLAAAVGAALLHRVRASYLRKTLNDRSLALDALWLFYGAFHGMLFALVGPGWAVVAVFGFLSYRAAGRLQDTDLAPTGTPSGHGLVFLRVFSLGQRSEKLFDAVTRHWRHIGSVQLITGPDLVHSVVQPHQLLDFLSRRLARHFIADERSLRLRVANCDRRPDRDGLYRVNGLFCHADTWETALVLLVGQGDTVLMDLRSFNEFKAGCLIELRYLMHHVPLARCVWIIDSDTDLVFLRHTLHKLREQMPPLSPNLGSNADDWPLLLLAQGPHGVSALLGRLAEAAAAGHSGLTS